MIDSVEKEPSQEQENDTQPLDGGADDAAATAAQQENAAANKDSDLSLETAALAPRPDVENPLLDLSRLSKSDSSEPQMRVAKRCLVGAIRDRNEDSCLVYISETGGHFPLLPFGLFIVADGMGGHKNGHIASKVASRMAARHIVENIYLPLLHVDGQPTATPVQEVLQNAVEKAHIALYDPTEETDSGTTLTIALVLGRRLYVAHVGDSRLYLLQKEKLDKITTDHSLVQRLQEVGQLTAEEAPNYQYRHVLLRAVGQGEEVLVDIYTRSLPKRGKLLLCSDGLSGLVSDSDMATVLQQDLTVDQLADELTSTAMEAGGYDNITAVIVDFSL